jgi:hypothetical protein
VKLPRAQAHQKQRTKRQPHAWNCVRQPSIGTLQHNLTAPHACAASRAKPERVMVFLGAQQQAAPGTNNGCTHTTELLSWPSFCTGVPMLPLIPKTYAEHPEPGAVGGTRIALGEYIGRSERRCAHTRVQCSNLMKGWHHPGPQKEENSHRQQMQCARPGWCALLAPCRPQTPIHSISALMTPHSADFPTSLTHKPQKHTARAHHMPMSTVFGQCRQRRSELCHTAQLCRPNLMLYCPAVDADIPAP